MKKKYLTPTMESLCMDTPLLQKVSVKGFTDGGTKSFGDTEEDTPKQTQRSLWHQMQNN